MRLWSLVLLSNKGSGQCQNLPCSFTQSEDRDKKFRPLALLYMSAWAVIGGFCTYSKTCVKQPLSKRPKFDSQDQLSLNAGQKYCRMLPLEHSAILSTFIKLQIGIKIFVLSIFERLFYTGFTVCDKNLFVMYWGN